MSWLFSDPKEYYDKVRYNYGRCCGACDGLKVNYGELDAGDNVNVISHFFSQEVKYKCGPNSGWLGKEYHFLSEQKSCFREGIRLWQKRDFEEIYKRLQEERRYFILTAICDILGSSRENRLFREIKTLIDLVREDSETEKEAIGYDSFGPEIANKLRIDKDNVSICNFLVENYLKNIYISIGLNQQEEAINTYKDMVMYLYMRYRNIDNYNEIVDAKQFENPKILVK